MLNSVEYYCPSSDEWHIMPSMIQPRISPRGVVAVNEQFYIVDGVDYDWDNGEERLLQCPVASLRPYVEKSSLSQQDWQELPQRPGPHPVDFVVVTEMHDFGT